MDDSGTTQTVWEKIKDLKKEAGEAAFNEKVYLLLRTLLKEEKYFKESVPEDVQIKTDCNELFNTWENYLIADNDTDFQQLKNAYFICEPKVERKLKNYVGRRSGEFANKAKDSAIRTGERARQLGNKALVEARKRKAQILKKSSEYAAKASLQYKNAHDKLLQTVQTIKSNLHSLSGPSKDKVLDEQVDIEVEASGITDEVQKAKYKQNLINFLNADIDIDTSNAEQSLGGHSTIGGARLTRKRKRKRKRKKRKTRRNRKLN